MKLGRNIRHVCVSNADKGFTIRGQKSRSQQDQMRLSDGGIHKDGVASKVVYYYYSFIVHVFTYKT